MLLDLFRTLGDPEIELMRARVDRLLMTVVTGEFRVLALSVRHLSIRDVHHVTAGTEIVLVLRVIPRCGTSPCDCGEDRKSHRGKSQHCRNASREKPVEDCLTMLEEKPDDRDGDNESDHDAQLLNPCRNCGQKKAHDIRYTARKRRLDSHGIERGVVRQLQQRECADHIIQRNRSDYRGAKAVRETCIELLSSPPIGPFNCPCTPGEAAGNP
jgi:hypothetical protein